MSDTFAAVATFQITCFFDCDGPGAVTGE